MAQKLNSDMEYAISLSTVESVLIFEEYFKLASLCNDIYEQLTAGISADSEIQKVFNFSIAKMYKRDGKFRSEVEVFPGAKSLISSIELN